MIKKIKIGDYIFNTKIVSTPEDVQNGMMHSHFDRNFNAMFFVLSENKMQSFWMKNCIIPLDMIFIDNNMKITKIHHSCMPCNYDDNNEYKCDHYKGFGNFVIEIEGGTCNRLNISQNQTIEIL